MTVVYVYGGPLKSALVERAYGFCGQSQAEFELSPEEYVVGLRALNDQMAQLPGIDYNAPPYGDGLPSDESGLQPDDVLGAAVFTAQLLASQIGKQFTPNGPQSRAMGRLVAKYQETPSVSLGRSTIRGAGNRRGAWRSPYLYSPPMNG